MNIYPAIIKAMTEIGPISKDKKNEQQGFKYRGIDDVMNALQPIMSKNGIFIVPEVLEHAREDRTSTKGNALIYSVCKMKYTFFADDGSSVAAVVVGEGMDSGDKSMNKAMAIAMKYACFQVFCIPTEEMKDPDGESHDLKPQDKPAGNNPPPSNQTGKNDSDKAAKEQIAEVFKAGKERKVNFPDFDIFKLIDDLAAQKKISNKFTYADKEKTKINWTQKDIEVLMEELSMPF